MTLYGSRLQPPVATGISRYVRHLLKELADTPPPDLEIAMASSPEPAGPEGLPAPLAHRSPPGPRRVLHTAWALGSRPRVDRFIGNPDLVHVLYPSVPVPSRAPAVYTLHDLMPLDHPDWFAAYERWAFGRAVRDAARRARAIIVDSQAVGRQVHAQLGVDQARLHVVHLGVGDEFRHPVAPDRVRAACAAHGVTPGRFLLALGNVSTRKNLGVVIDAMAHLPATSRLPLLVVGPDTIGADDVRALVRRRHLGDEVHFAGWLPSAQLPALLSGARALVHPSVEEGFGMTPLEAMAMGTPAVVSRAGALPEVVGEAALLVDASDPASWAAALTSVCDDHELRADLVRRGREHAAGYTWARTAAQTLTVYRSCVASGGG